MENLDNHQLSPDASSERIELVSTDKELQACQSCRRRKLRCSRETLVCSQCSRLGCACIYDRKKQKPGMKSGAVESLSRRLELLEKMLLDRNGVPKKLVEEHDLLRYNTEIQSSTQSDILDLPGTQNLQPCQQYDDHPDISGKYLNDNEFNSGQKRKWSETSYNFLDRTWDFAEEDVLNDTLPSFTAMKFIITCFSELLHPWIPFIHLGKLHGYIEDPKANHISSIILHAIVFSTIHHCKNEDLGMTQTQKQDQVKRSKNLVMLTATSWLALENVQALLIIAFHHMGCGNFSNAWPILASLTRTVQYLQLTVESDQGEHHSLLEPLSLLAHPQTWTESENRRRILWNVFLLDRFCSVTTGWNTSLTSDDVQCKLPCDGGHWHREEPVTTPFFGIWDKAAAKIGNSVAYIPSYYPSPDNENSHSTPCGSVGLGTIDISKLGAFAYCIEATESLSQVTTFFLQQKVNFLDRTEVNSWLTRFKELDLRLVHWKMFLPQKWRDSDISNDGGTVNMDPNLTLAHITHNTSMILLHQHIAYPPGSWSDLVKLPSACSIETCRSAAVETASITQKYLNYTLTGILNHQFAFCVFVAARLLLGQSRLMSTALPNEYHTLLLNLHHISRRWNGREGDEGSSYSHNLGRIYAEELQSLDQKYTNPGIASVDTILSSSPRLNAASAERMRSKPKSRCALSKNKDSSMNRTVISHAQTSISSLETQKTMTRSNLEPDNEGNVLFQREASNLLEPTTVMHNVQDELAEMSEILLGQQFLEMDRVITFDGTDFSLAFEGWE